MTDDTRHMNEAELADHYDTHRDSDEWGDPVPVTVRRAVVLSVRFSDEEIAAIRERAAAAGMKPTAYIRQAATTTDASYDREQLRRAVAVLSSELERLRGMVGGAAA